MKALGLIGAMSWESTAIYHRHLNEMARERLGGLHSAKLLMWSFDFAEVAERQHADDWAGAAALMTDAACRLERAGAEALVMCTNTMHKVADEVQRGSAADPAHRRCHRGRHQVDRVSPPCPAGDPLHDGAGFLQAAPA